MVWKCKYFLVQGKCWAVKNKAVVDGHPTSPVLGVGVFRKYLETPPRSRAESEQNKILHFHQHGGERIPWSWQCVNAVCKSSRGWKRLCDSPGHSLGINQDSSSGAGHITPDRPKYRAISKIKFLNFWTERTDAPTPNPLHSRGASLLQCPVSSSPETPEF